LFSFSPWLNKLDLGFEQLPFRFFISMVAGSAVTGAFWTPVCGVRFRSGAFLVDGAVNRLLPIEVIFAHKLVVLHI
jgi:hypothetical protein